MTVTPMHVGGQNPAYRPADEPPGFSGETHTRNHVEPFPEKFNCYNAFGLACVIIGLMWMVISLARNDNRIGIHVPIAMMWNCIGLAIVARGRNKAKTSDAKPQP